ncbi:D-aminopeptidase [Oecophyllibacter saccharovorans]|uniref:D-aminopeptidase n=1 Tax=Oecophyllibacter saccharovorans TaxID=2558360 RepID=A0A506UL94_9PROT|nr:D-aminopeptidase [Oecophyllibacter saccharovorans]TPW34106.1 D-aminopeptidase [Oecophyllibacter saccharovorans]
MPTAPSSPSPGAPAPSRINTSLERLVADLPDLYPGPGGAVAVIRDGETLVRHAWGYASLERRLPFTPASLFRLCSITKQFTCATLLARYRDPEHLNRTLAPFIARRLPELPADLRPSALHLAHNQSGLRDYWAMAMLEGAAIEGAFSDADAWRLIARTRSLQFSPGTVYSYVNQNFRLLSDAMEQESGRSFSELLQQHLFTPLGMERAFLAAETRAMPDGTEGYEGMGLGGARPAVNNIYWTGDAGLGASLDDMITWEKHIDATRDDAGSLYQRLSAPVTFADGAAASYGFGLQRGTLNGPDGPLQVTGHGGALRGWRSHRLHVPQHRLSVVVLFNHVSPAHQAAAALARAALTAAAPAPSPSSHNPQEALASAAPFTGVWLEEGTGLSARISRDTTDPHSQTRLQLRYLMLPETLTLQSPEQASGPGVMLQRVEGKPDLLKMSRPGENRVTFLHRLSDRLPEERMVSDTERRGLAEEARALAGTYRNPETDSTFDVTLAGGVLHGGFSGLNGTGRMERLHRLAPGLWTFPCPRALDHTAPGDWTLHFTREGGRSRVRIGCWLARDLVYERLPG